MSNIDHGGGCTCEGMGSIWKISVLSAQLCCEPKPAPKTKISKM